MSSDLSNSTESMVLFYNQGSSATSATIIRFKTVEDVKRNKTYLEIHAIGSGWDRSLGMCPSASPNGVTEQAY
jgi:hypothetical protein